MRVAFLNDSLHEVNRVAQISRMLTATAERLKVPFRVVCAGLPAPASEARICAFAPDVIYVTGPSDVGTIGVVLAKKPGLPLVASWHTNLQEYAGERLPRFVPGLARRGCTTGSRPS